jgi:hypothetical protein
MPHPSYLHLIVFLLYSPAGLLLIFFLEYYIEIRYNFFLLQELSWIDTVTDSATEDEHEVETLPQTLSTMI